MHSLTPVHLAGIVFVVAKTSVSSPRKVFIFIIFKNVFLDQSIQDIYYFILKTKSVLAGEYSSAEARARSDGTESIWAWGANQLFFLLANTPVMSPQKVFSSII